MRRNIAVLVPQQHLARFLTYPSRSESAAKGVFKVMHPDMPESPRGSAAELLCVGRRRPSPGMLPRIVIHAPQTAVLAVLASLIGKHKLRMYPAPCIHYRHRH